jgi:dienelactone hydrolase
MTRTAIALALLLLLPPALARADELTVTMGGRTLGRETLTRDGDAQVATAELQVLPEGEPFRYEARTTVDAEGRFVSYELTSNTHAAIAQVTTAGLSLQVSVAGSRHERLLEGAGPWLVLDNLVFSHYDLLGRFAAGADGPLELTVVVPQALRAFPATCRPGARTTVVVRGVERPARELSLTLANLLVEALVDAETGVAYRVRVPSQELEAVREGLARPAGPPVGPSTTVAPAVCPGREREVAFPSPGVGEVPGTLTVPREGEGPWPVVVFLHGSGPNDRDETIGPNKPLRDLAWQLAEAGVASLRYDKRTYLLLQRVRATETTPEARQAALDALQAMTLEEESIQDGVAALKFLATRPEVADVGARFLAGHSLGALAAPYVARWVEPEDVRGVAVLAGAGRTLDVLLREQSIYQSTLAGLSQEEAEAQADALLSPLRDGAAGLGDDAPFFGATGRYWKDLLARDPAVELGGLSTHVLLLQGEADCQVRLADHERLLEAREDSLMGTRAIVFPELNHLFMRVDGRSTGAEYHSPGRVDPAVGRALAEWIQDVLADRIR